MKNLKLIMFFVLITIFVTPVSAQLKSGNKLYSQFKFSKAIPYFLKASNSKEKDERKIAKIRLADCYRKVKQFSEASKWYEKVLEEEIVNPEIFFNYATVLRNQGKYNEAEKYFKTYLEKVPGNKVAKKYLQYCRDIVSWENIEASAKVKNLEALNTPFTEFSPVFYKNGIVFVSDRDIDLWDNNNYLWTGNGFLNLYFTELSETNQPGYTFSFPEKMPKPINQPYHDGPACFTDDGQIIFTTRTLKQKQKKKDTIQTYYTLIYYASLDGKKPKFEPFAYNGDSYSVGHPTFSDNSNILIFSSDMPGGQGESDLYFSMLENGGWTRPENLGSLINSFGNEYFPYLANDTTLYFSSDGHMGYGGLDIYVSSYKNGQWQKPVNLKAPINSSYDDFGIIFFKNHNNGFFSSNRKGGKGGDDIYFMNDFKLQINNPEQIVSY